MRNCRRALPVPRRSVRRSGKACACAACTQRSCRLALPAPRRSAWLRCKATWLRGFYGYIRGPRRILFERLERILSTRAVFLPTLQSRALVATAATMDRLTPVYGSDVYHLRLLSQKPPCWVCHCYTAQTDSRLTLPLQPAARWSPRRQARRAPQCHAGWKARRAETRCTSRPAWPRLTPPPFWLRRQRRRRRGLHSQRRQSSSSRRPASSS